MAEIDLRNKPIARLKNMYAEKSEKEAQAKEVRQNRLDVHPPYIAEKERWTHEHSMLELNKINRSHILSRHQAYKNNLAVIEKELFGE